MQTKTMQTDRPMLRRYLLGTLPEDLATEVDARLFAEDKLHLQLQEEQDALIEDFVYGRLAPDEEVPFESQCALSPLLQRKVESFRTFLSALERQSTPALLGKAPYFSLARILVPAMALMLCVVSLVYFRELRRNAILISQLQASSRAPAPATPSDGGKVADVVAFLSANIPRAPDTAPEITVPASAAVLELQVELRAPVTGEIEWDSADWDVELLRGDEVIFSSAYVRLRRIGHQTFLPLFVDAKSVQAGSYTVRYSPHSDPGAVQFRPFYVVN